jgi:uncharacterized protein (TIGR03067 family)
MLSEGLSMRGFTTVVLVGVILAVVLAFGCNRKPSGTPVGATVDPKVITAELGSLAGTWVYERQVVEGHEVPIAELRQDTIVITGNSLVRNSSRADGKGLTINSSISVDPTTSPKQMDDDANLGFRISRRPGIYKLEGNMLTLCYDNKGAQRPTVFESPEGSSFALTVLRRQGR